MHFYTWSANTVTQIFQGQRHCQKPYSGHFALVLRSIISENLLLTTSLIMCVSSCLSLYYNCDSATIRLRHDSDEKMTCSFFARVEWKQARAIRRSRIVVVSQSNRTHVAISITSIVVECVVVSSCRSHIIVESRLYSLTAKALDFFLSEWENSH